MKRTDARILFMQLLFQMSSQNNYSRESKDRFISLFMENDESQLTYFNQLFDSFSENKDIIDQAIEKTSENWKINRIAKVDLAVLRVAITEIFYLEDVPDSVAINEAVDISKKFGTEDSGKFVNGILGKVVKM